MINTVIYSPFRSPTDRGSLQSWRAFAPRYLLALASAAWTGTASAAPKYWVGASGTTNTPSGGTWQTTTTPVWSDGTVDNANAGWAAGDTAFFGGPSGNYAVQVGGAISMASAQFSASGYALTNSIATTITATRNPYLIVDPGTTNTIGTNITITTNLVITFNPGLPKVFYRLRHP